LHDAESLDPSEEFLETVEYYGYTIEDLREIKNKPLNIDEINRLLEYEYY
jgi:hypothetical protein